jgi:transposase InsO family protein
MSQLSVTSATGTDLVPLGIAHCTINVGEITATHPFIVCSRLNKPVIMGYDLQQKHRIGTAWTEDGRMYLHKGSRVIVQAIEQAPKPFIYNTSNVDIPPFCQISILCKRKGFNEESWRQLESEVLDVVPSQQFLCEYPDLLALPTIHLSEEEEGHSNPLDRKHLPPRQFRPKEVPFFIVNTSSDPIRLKRRTVLAHLTSLDSGHRTEKSEKLIEFDNIEISLIDTTEVLLPESEFIKSPADITPHQKVILKDAEVAPHHLKYFEELCAEFPDIFSQHASDVGKTDLITMRIETGDNHPIAQRPYTLPLKHFEYVKDQIEQLDTANLIVRSISPWASPVVIVPKRAEPGQPPQKRLCVDYRALNSLLPPVQKANSHAKGVLTLVPLPKIDELYAKLYGATVFSSLDARSGYYHIALDEESQPKTAFVVPFGKWQFKRVPFGLAQAPAYFQMLINKILVGLDFAFGYLDDILIYSPDAATHLVHLRIVFNRLRAADLKLKMSKCGFFKAHIQYLGHLISGSGIQPLPDKVTAVQTMPRPKNPHDIRHVLGLTGYYRKFIPGFSDLARPLNELTRHGVPYIWTEVRENAFQQLKATLTSDAILTYPQPNETYVLFTDASKYAWSGVLTQTDPRDIGTDREGILRPITYLSGLFRGPQLNWAALTKEAYAIFMAVRKLSFYIDGAKVILRSDHMPLRKFLEKNTKNNKVNNWAHEISHYDIEFQYIKGIKNTLADVLSRLVDLEITETNPAELPGQEFGEMAFDELPACEIHSITMYDAIAICATDVTLDLARDRDPRMISDEELLKLQGEDSECQDLRARLIQGALKEDKFFIDDANLLRRRTFDGGPDCFEALVVPKPLRAHILYYAHDTLGHNGTTRTYHFIKRFFFWPGLRPAVDKHIRGCLKCRRRNLQAQKYAPLHLPVPSMPLEFISMDLIGPFEPITSRRNKFALTVIDMLTGYVWCIPIPNKTAEVVTQAYIQHVYAKFGGSLKVLSDNGTEFKNELTTKIAPLLGIEVKIYTASYYPQENGRIEGFHNFLKGCISKHVSTALEWDDVVPLACAGYNFFPNEHSRESAFFLMFGRDPITPLAQFLTPKARYVGDSDCMLSLEQLRKIYALAAENIRRARTRQDAQFKQHRPHPDFKIGDAVLVKDHTAHKFDPRFHDQYRITQFPSTRQVEVTNQKGKARIVHISDLQFVFPCDRIIGQMPDADAFGRAAKMTYVPHKLEELDWQLATDVHTNMTDDAPIAAASIQTQLGVTCASWPDWHSSQIGVYMFAYSTIADYCAAGL